MHNTDKFSKHDLVRGLPNHKHNNDQVYNAFIKGKQVIASFKPLKTVFTTRIIAYDYVAL